MAGGRWRLVRARALWEPELQIRRHEQKEKQKQEQQALIWGPQLRYPPTSIWQPCVLAARRLPIAGVDAVEAFCVVNAWKIAAEQRPFGRLGE